MKRIEFIAPVEAVRGNLSGAQKLLYPSNNNTAFEAPDGKTSYANNYRSSYIGAKRASDGLKYFVVKTKTAVNLSNRMKYNLALQGGTFAMVSKLLSDEGYNTVFNTAYATEMTAGSTSATTLRQYVTEKVREMIASYQASFTVSVAGFPQTFFNPWVSTEATKDYYPSRDVIVKFWTLLAPGGIYFYVNQLRGVAKNNNADVTEDFGTLIASAHNVLGLTAQSEGTYVGFIMKGTMYLCYDITNDQGETVKMSPTSSESVEARKYYLDTTPGENGG